MATYNKFEGFVGYLGLGAVNLNTDQINVYATNNAPSASGDDVLADLVGITVEHGYDVADITNLYSEASGTGTLTAADVTWTASAGSFGPLKYCPLYDLTHANDILIGWWEYPAAAVTVLTGESFKVDFGASVFTIA
jgi:hypothetical protein